MAKILIGRKLNQSTDSVTVKQGVAGTAGWPVKDLTKLVPKEYDHIELVYDTPPNQDDVVQATYKSGGPSGTTVAVLTLAYNANRNISSVTRT